MAFEFVTNDGEEVAVSRVGKVNTVNKQWPRDAQTSGAAAPGGKS